MNHSVTESGTADNQEPLFSETFRKKSDRAPSSEKAQKSLWADFAATGNVEAYLRYRRAFGQRKDEYSAIIAKSAPLFRQMSSIA